MKNDRFQFQQFDVRHDRSSMKVGTDAVLLGAWCMVLHAKTALDVGTGCGLIALMLAQRNPDLRKVVGLDIDSSSVMQAEDNFRNSPFASRLSAVRMDFRTPQFALDTHFDLIVSNPPFFTEQTASPDAARDCARRADYLPMETLIAHAATLLTKQGRLSLVLPRERSAECIWAAQANGLYLNRRMDVRQRDSLPYVRSLLEFSYVSEDTLFGHLTLTEDGSKRTMDYESLTKDFYLKDHEKC